MGIKVHASSPPLVTGLSASSTVATAAFDPPAGSLIVACVVANSSTTGVTVAAVTNNKGLTFTEAIRSDYSHAAQPGYSMIAIAPCVSAQTGMTVTVTTTGSTSTTRRPTVRVYVLTGADLSAPVNQVARYTTSISYAEYSFVQALDDVFLVVADSDWSKSGPESSRGMDAYEGFDQAGADGVSGLFAYRQLKDVGTVTFLCDGYANSAARHSTAMLLVKPAPAAASTAGVTFLPELGSTSRVAVEIAWGADLASVVSDWVWSDVTPDVRVEQGINTRLGRGDEAGTSQPANLTFTVDNAAGKYSLGGASVNWPNVRRNTPVRVTVDPGDGGGYATMFVGFADGFTPGWDSETGKVPTVEVSASGTLRRLLQRDTPVLSPYRRAYTVDPNIVGYWPLEERGDASVVEGIRGALPGVVTGLPDFGGCTAFAASNPVVTMKPGSSIFGSVSTYYDTAEFQVRALLAFPKAGDLADNAVLLRVLFSSGLTRWDVLYGTGGSLKVNVYNEAGTLVRASGSLAFSVDDSNVRLALTGVRLGTSLDWQLQRLTPYPLGGNFQPFTDTGATGIVSGVVIAPNADLDGLGVGHVTVQDHQTGLFEAYQPLLAYGGEYPTSGSTGRFERVCGENGIRYTRFSSAGTGLTPADAMGPQPITDVVGVLRDVEDVDGGQLWDGLINGLAYTTRRFTESRPADLTLAASQLSAPFAPVDDDQRTLNKVAAQRPKGSTVVVEQVTGPAGTAAIGVYDGQVNVNVADDALLGFYAGWALNKGTVVGYRFPTVTVDLRANPTLARAALGMKPGMRIDITGAAAVLSGLPPEPISLVVEGIAHRMAPREWKVTFKCSPFAAWSVGLLAAASGDTSEFVERLDTAGAQLSAPANAGATTVSVTTTAGPLWSTNSDDYPLLLDIGGMQVRASACSGATSPQVFTTAALPRAFAAGTPVKVWNPPVLGL